MNLTLASQRLYRAVARNKTYHTISYWYSPDRFDVRALRAMKRQEVTAALVRAETRGDVGIVTGSTIDVSATEILSLRRWFRKIGEALVKSLHLTR